MPQIDSILVTASAPGADISRDGSFEPLGGAVNGLTTYVGGDIFTDGTTSVVTGPPTVAALQSTLSISLHRPSKTSRIAKVRVKLIAPIAALDSVTGLPVAVKSHENSVDVTYTFSEKSTEAERVALDQMFQALINTDPAIQVVHGLKSLF